jgi:DivIVA domain-containing protein
MPSSKLATELIERGAIMALTPDDVVTKQFQHVRFKDGFDPDEVDDFLDEIVIEWRKALEENVELKAKLAAYESGAAPEAAETTAAAPAAPAVTEAPAAPVAEAPASARRARGRG